MTFYSLFLSQSYLIISKDLKYTAWVIWTTFMILGYSELDSSGSHTIQLHRKTSVHPQKLSAFVFHGTKKIKQVWNDMRRKQCQNRFYCLNCSSSCPMRVFLSFSVRVHPIFIFFLCECLCTAYKLSLDENNPGPPGRERSSERFKGLLIIVAWAVARKRVGGRMTVRSLW